MSYHEVRDGNGFGESEVENTIAEERGERTDTEEEPGRELVAGETREDAKILAEIVGDAEERELALVETENGFERVGVESESEGVAGSNLNPHRCS